MQSAFTHQIVLSLSDLGNFTRVIFTCGWPVSEWQLKCLEFRQEKKVYIYFHSTPHNIVLIFYKVHFNNERLFIMDSARKGLLESQRDQSSQVQHHEHRALEPTKVIALLPHSLSAAAASTEDGGNKRSLGPLIRPAVAFPPTAALSASQLCCVSSAFLLGPLGTAVNSEH